MKAPESPLSSLDRRTFLRGAVAGTALSGFPHLLLSQDTQPAIVGKAGHKYECLHGWGTLPDAHSYGGASHGVTLDEAGQIYIAHRGAPGSVFVFDPEGKFVKSMIPEHQGNGHGIDLRKEGGTEYLYLSPANAKLGFYKATIDGKILWGKTKADIEKDIGEPLPRFRPTNVSFSPNGNVILGDGYGSAFLFEYTADGKFVGHFGGGGTEDGKFRTPHGQWLDDRDGTPKTVVCDRANARLQWFDMKGKHLKTMPGFLFPADIDIRGEIMAVPDLHARITLLDKENKVIAHLGDDVAWRTRVLDKKEGMRNQTPDKWPAGKFVHPHDAAFDKEGNLFVVEWVNGGRVTKLRRVS